MRVIPRTASTPSGQPPVAIWAYGSFQQLAPDGWKNIRALLSPQVDPSKPKYYTGPGWSQGVNAKSKNKTGARVPAVRRRGARGDLFSSGIVTPIAGWTSKYKFNDLPDSDVWHRMSSQGTPLTLSATTQLTETLRENEFQNAFEAIMFEKKDLHQSMNTWNAAVQKALDDL